MRAAIDKILDDNHLDALIRPASAGNDMAALSGYPDLLVQGGVDANGISAGIGFVAKAFTEPQSLGYAYAYEQGVHARIVPALTPPIPSSWWR
jgi:amidase